MASTVRLLEEAEIAAAADTLAASFDEDPLFCYMLPEPAKRSRWLRLIMTAAVRTAFPDGAVFCAGDGPEAGAMALLPPGSYPPPSGRSWSFAFRRGLRPGLPWPTWPLLRAGIPVLRRMGRVHPKDDHMYIQVVGVSPSRKGQGIGGQLMRHVVAMAEEASVSIYLETSNEVNLGFYNRYGFEVAEQIDAPRDAPPVWTMVRPAPAERDA